MEDYVNTNKLQKLLTYMVILYVHTERVLPSSILAFTFLMWVREFDIESDSLASESED